MKKLSLFLFLGLFALISCRNEQEGGENLSNGNALVEMSFLTPNTRALTPEQLDDIAKGTADEKTINSLDLLVYKSDQFQYRRYAIPYGSSGNTFRATLKVDDGLTVYFVANARTLIEQLIDSNQLVDESEVAWETIRKLLIDSNPARFATTDERKNLPMWGKKESLKVTENIVENWTGIYLLRAVAGVDIYQDASVTNFELKNATLYFVPDKGCWAPSAANYTGGNSVTQTESADGMKTSINLGPYAAEDNKVVCKFYLYDNDTNASSYASDRRYTRVVVGGIYGGQMYYYPIDFLKYEDDLVRYDAISRNTKYIFEITKVTGPGYPDPDMASVEPPVSINTNVYQWIVDGDTEAGFDGIYYVSLRRKQSIVSRPAGSTDQIKLTSNAHPSIIRLNFETNGNGAQTDLASEPGIQNDRFSVEKILNQDGSAITGLKVTALGDYDPATPSRNLDAVILQTGNIEFRITIKQIDGNSTDWEWGGDEEIILNGN